MTVWNYSVSWSKFELALRCQKALGLTIDKAPGGTAGPTLWMDAGKLVQKTFELYFNQRINLRPKANHPDVLRKAAERVLNSDWAQSLNTTYPFDLTKADLETKVKAQVEQGRQSFEKLGIIDRPISAELKVNATFASRGLRIFALIDFLHRDDNGAHCILDGKGHREENANPDQVRYYALALAALDRKLGRSGLLYWDHGFREVDVSPPAMRAFIEEKVTPAALIFQKLKHGTTDLPANPIEANCKKCTWRHSCTDSLYYRQDPDPSGSDEVGLTGCASINTPEGK